MHTDDVGIEVNENSPTSGARKTPSSQSSIMSISSRETSNIDSPKTTSTKLKRFSFSAALQPNKDQGDEEEEGSFIRDASMLSQKLASPQRMFGKGLSIRQSINKESPSSGGLDFEEGVNRVSHVGGGLFRKDPGTLPLKGGALDTIARDVSFSSFSRVKHICDGSNSNLFKCTWEDRDVIVKRLKIVRIAVPHVLSEFEFESEFLRRSADCPHLVRILAYGFDLINEFDLPDDVTFDPSSQLAVTSASGDRLVQVPFVVLEPLTGGSLGFFLSKQRNYHSRPFTVSRALCVMRQLAEALCYIHEEFDPNYCVIHRDLKPDNLVFDDHDTLRLIDFGLSICVRKTGSSKESFAMTGGTGSLRYMAPEVASSLPYNDRSDIYSWAIIAYEVLTGVAPYGNMNKQKFVTRVIEKRERPPLDLDDYGRRIRAPQAAKDLIERCWNHDHTLRPSASEILKSCRQLEAEQIALDARGSSCGCS